MALFFELFAYILSIGLLLLLPISYGLSKLLVRDPPDFAFFRAFFRRDRPPSNLYNVSLYKLSIGAHGHTYSLIPEALPGLVSMGFRGVWIVARIKYPVFLRQFLLKRYHAELLSSIAEAANTVVEGRAALGNTPVPKGTLPYISNSAVALHQVRVH